MAIVTIAGDPGSGKSTLAKALAAALDLPHFSMGDIFRRLAQEGGMSVEEFTRLAQQDPDAWDSRIDPYQCTIPEQHPAFVMDSRLGFHFLPHSIKIYVKVDREEAARRLFRQQRAEERWESVEEGVRSLRERQGSERERFARLYGVDHTDLSQFDLVLDSTRATAEETLAQALAYLKSRGVTRSTAKDAAEG